MFYRIEYRKFQESWHYTCDIPTYEIADALYNQLQSVKDMYWVKLYRVTHGIEGLNTHFIKVWDTPN